MSWMETVAKDAVQSLWPGTCHVSFINHRELGFFLGNGKGFMCKGAILTACDRHVVSRYAPRRLT